MCSNNGGTLPGSSRPVEKSSFLLQIEKASKNSDGDVTCRIFSHEKTVAHVVINNHSKILAIKTKT